MLFSIFGPSCSGKDTIANELFQEKDIKKLLQHTTRPMRPGETEGVEYYFHNNHTDAKEPFCLKSFEVANGETWYYWFELDDAINAIESRDKYITITDVDGTLKLLEKGAYAIRINVPIEIRIKRYYERESLKTNPDFKEAMRRIIADIEDFDEREIAFVHKLNNKLFDVNNSEVLTDAVRDVNVIIHTI